MTIRSKKMKVFSNDLKANFISSTYLFIFFG